MRQLFLLCVIGLAGGAIGFIGSGLVCYFVANCQLDPQVGGAIGMLWALLVAPIATLGGIGAGAAYCARTWRSFRDR